MAEAQGDLVLSANGWGSWSGAVGSGRHVTVVYRWSFGDGGSRAVCVLDSAFGMDVRAAVADDIGHEL